MTIRSMEFHWKRLIVKEYATPFAWVTGITLLGIKHTYLQWGYEDSKGTLWVLSIFISLITLAFFVTWYLKKRKVLRSD